MSIINVLPSKIYNRIAAGEVIERPASVVKELVENSIDSGAKNISIEIISGGKTLIRVIDDGCGIEKSQIKKALLSHATSKISAISDLDNISTLGFRGEALPSIASVSKLKITSKTSNQELGAYVTCEGGDTEGPFDIGFSNGTEIEVNNLFYNTPAREKFLKTDRTEEGEISSVIERFILSKPDISFKYIADGKIVSRSFGDGLESAFVSVYGTEVLKNCFYVNTERNGIKIEGYVGKHHFTKPNRGYQSLFVNGRYVVDSTVSSAITNAYGNYLMRRQYPFYVLSLNLPVDFVDVNVHPNKLNVRFQNNGVVYGTIYSVISKILEGSSEVVNIIKDEKPKGIVFSNDKTRNYVTHNVVDSKKNNGLNFLTFSDNKIDIFDENKLNNKNSNIDIFAENKAYIEKLEKEKLLKNKENIIEQEKIVLNRDLTYIGQALNTYLIYDDGENIYFIDQHAAHERLLFDKLMQNFINKDFELQSMLIPYVLTVNDSEFNFIKDKMDFLSDFGFEIEEFGRNAFKISSVPVIVSSLNLENFFNDLLSEINTLKNINAGDLFYEKIAQKACKSAIKAGDKLTDSEIKILSEQLKNNLGLKCPHGRPIAIKVTKIEIEKWFKRIV